MRNTIIALVVIVVLGAGGYAIYKSQQKPAGQPSQSQNQNQTPTPPPASDQNQSSQSTGQSGSQVTVNYGDNGFSPASVSGTAPFTLVVKNSGNQPLSFNSDPHPQHTQCPPLNLGVISSGQSKSVTIDQPMTCGFHNHFDPTMKGTLTATATTK